MPEELELDEELLELELELDELVLEELLLPVEFEPPPPQFAINISEPRTNSTFNIFIGVHPELIIREVRILIERLD